MIIVTLSDRVFKLVSPKGRFLYRCIWMFYLSGQPPKREVAGCDLSAVWLQEQYWSRCDLSV